MKQPRQPHEQGGEPGGRILELFEKHRAVPGAPYDEDHFLDFLMKDPKSKGALHNSFGGLRRFNAFLNDVQYEFAICFSIKDREANYSLNRFVDRVISLQQSRRGSLRSLQRQIRDGPGWGGLFFVDSVLMMIGYLMSNFLWAIVAVIVAVAALNIGFMVFAWRARTYLLHLRERIEGR